MQVNEYQWKYSCLRLKWKDYIWCQLKLKKCKIYQRLCLTVLNLKKGQQMLVPISIFNPMHTKQQINNPTCKSFIKFGKITQMIWSGFSRFGLLKFTLVDGKRGGVRFETCAGMIQFKVVANIFRGCVFCFDCNPSLATPQTLYHTKSVWFPFMNQSDFWCHFRDE